MKRRWAFLLLSGGLILAGCSYFERLSVRSQSPEEAEPEESATRLVGEVAVPFGMFPVRVEAVGLVTGLPGTGSDAGPSAQRAMLVEEMKARGVKNPNALLASPSTSLVLVQGWLRPGVRKGDRFDVEVRVASRSETSSLRGGWLLETRLKDMAVLGDNHLHEGRVWALAEGPVLVDPAAEAKNDSVAPGRGRVLGGAVAMKSRDLGLVLTPGHQNVAYSARVAGAVNRRFHTFDKGIQVGVAKAKTDKFIELSVHPRYKDNIARYVHVVRAIALRETDTEQMDRISRLQKRLLEPATAGEAAIQLEAVGTQGIAPLKKALESKHLEVRFYAAEALAYLDQREAAEPLGQIARDEPAFRVFALTALSAMADYAAYEQLRDMLGLPSAETRYGAFRALWAMNPSDGLVAGERLGDRFNYHVLDVGGPPMIHVTHNRRPEVVLFGPDQRFATPLVVNAGNQILITTVGPDELSLSKFSVGEADQKRVVSTRVDEVIRAIVDLGGTYPDVVQALQEAKAAGALGSRFQVDAVPEAGRTYRRVRNQRPEAGQQDGQPGQPSSPSPELFAKPAADKNLAREDPPEHIENDREKASQPAKKTRSLGGWFARMVGRNPE